jgi:hypothetical protein
LSNAIFSFAIEANGAMAGTKLRCVAGRDNNDAQFWVRNACQGGKRGLGNDGAFQGAANFQDLALCRNSTNQSCRPVM